MKTLLIFTPLVLIYLVIYNIEIVLSFLSIVLSVLLIISLFFFVIWLSGDGIFSGSKDSHDNDSSLFKGIIALGLYNNAKEKRERRERNRNRDF